MTQDRSAVHGFSRGRSRLRRGAGIFKAEAQPLVPPPRFDPPSRAPRPPADRLLVLLKTRGPLTTAALGKALGVTGEAARQQLIKLAEEGLTKATTAAPKGVGRPSQLWSLTPAANARFPDAHAELTVQLLGNIKTVLGEGALEQLIAAREAGARASYKAALEGAKDLEERVERLTEIRARDGYMAEWRRDGNGWLLIENHCPICVAATACHGFCEAELRVFTDVLGPGVEVTRVEHAVDGARRCAYRIVRGKRKRLPRT